MAGWRSCALCWGLTALSTLGTARTQELDKPTPIDRRPDHFQNMTSQLLRELDARLNLTDDQKAMLVRLKKEFQNKHRDELKQLRQDVKHVQQALQQARQNKNTLAMADARGQAVRLRQIAEKLRTEFERQLLEILTDAQKRQYQAIRKELARPGKKMAR